MEYTDRQIFLLGNDPSQRNPYVVHNKQINQNIMAQYDDVNDLLLKLSYLGFEKDKYTGAILIGKDPNPLYRNGWLNYTYPTVTSVEIEKIEDATKKTVPASYVQFITEYSNGLKVLGNTLCLFGYRYDYIRDMEHVWQPYSIIEVNKYKYERPLNAEKDMFFYRCLRVGRLSLVYDTRSESPFLQEERFSESDFMGFASLHANQRNRTAIPAF